MRIFFFLFLTLVSATTFAAKENSDLSIKGTSATSTDTANPATIKISDAEFSVPGAVEIASKNAIVHSDKNGIVQYVELSDGVGIAGNDVTFSAKNAVYYPELATLTSDSLASFSPGSNQPVVYTCKSGIIHENGVSTGMGSVCKTETILLVCSGSDGSKLITKFYSRVISPCAW
ncbi:hypothetical protein [Arenimonas oryziterrae]|uniref:hypothetical protein n=1 Tax=Arenimonas oryziterrae TaxID=498055 RepID=UPI0012DDBF4C|nr:hypothetical protein [Arenimonas oryziterrae]